jgi:Ca-activated chloride channel homolog
MTCVKVAGLIGLFCTMLSFAQGTKDVPVQDSSQVLSLPALHVDVDLVVVNAAVTDSMNKHVSDLKKEDFHIWEDKIEQNIEYFSKENVPLSVGIIVDVSGSMQDKLGPARAAANTFMRMGDEGDEYFLIEFSDSPKTVQEFTTDITRLQSRLIFNRAKGSTALYDALYLALDKVERGSNSRKALLLITDGMDNHSRYSFSEVRTFAMEHDVLIYGIGIVDDNDFDGYGGKVVLQSLANITGGAAFFPQFVGALESICGQIAVDLKNQYLLGYRPLNLSNDGKWRKIRVKVNRPKGTPPLSVRAKSGYFAPTIAKLMR